MGRFLLALSHARRTAHLGGVVLGHAFGDGRECAAGVPGADAPGGA